MTDPAPDRRPLPRADTPAEEVISRELVAGEYLIWTGRPPQGLCLRRADWRNLFGLTLFAATEITFMAMGGGPFVAMNGVAIGSALGLHFIHRFILVPGQRRHTWYGLTSERVLVVARQSGATRLSSIVLSQIADVHLTEWADGSGVIDFGNPPPSPRHAEKRSIAWVMTRVAVVELPAGVRTVFELIRDVQRANSRDGRGPGGVRRACLN
ncbi:MAG TPA: hypothetical protein VH092_17345 [Urbifossiella sp.]|nr:hypothetical protein [Urbifossiella sp.]